MDTTKIAQEINRHRRYFIGGAAAAAAAAQLGMIGLAAAQPANTRASRLPAIKPGTHTSFAPLKQIDAGVLNVGYAEAGPADGPAVILLHGWPYDIYSFVDVAPLLASAGYRVIIPYLRGYGTTRFLSSDTSAQWPAVRARLRRHRPDGRAQDREGDHRRLRLGRAHRQHRRRALAGALQGHGVGQRLSDRQPARPTRCRCRRRPSSQWWYQFYFATERGRAGYDKYRRDFSKLIWQLGFAEVALRRRHVRSQRRGIRQPRSCRHRDPQLSLASRTWPTASRSTTRSKSGSPNSRSSRCPRSRWKAMPTAHRIRTRAPTRRSSPASTSTGSSPAASGTTCRRKRRRRSPRPSSTSPAKADRQRPRPT